MFPLRLPASRAPAAPDGRFVAASFAGAALAIAWAWLGWWLGRRHEGQLHTRADAPTVLARHSADSR